MKAVFRVDASVEIGSGHLMRCLALAYQLEKQGWSCHFACSHDSAQVVPDLLRSGFDIIQIPTKAAEQGSVIRRAMPDGVALLVIDHYELGVDFGAACRPWAQQILVIDDLANRSHDADILLDQTYGRNDEDYQRLIPAYCTVLAGAKYALLRPEFAAMRDQALTRRDKQKGIIKRILISIGGSDPDNVTGLVLESVHESGIDAIVDVVLGAGTSEINSVRRQVELLPQAQLFTDVENMAAMMAKADLGIGAGGTTSWERCCLGLPTLAMTVAKNQLMINRNLHVAGAVNYLGWYSDLDKSVIGSAIQAIKLEPEKLQIMTKFAQVICDGKGAIRVANLLKKQSQR